MARTRAADHDDKRDAIMAHAARLFAARGFGGASLSELAAACRTSKSLIYHYYASKEAILYDVMCGHIDALTAAKDDVARSKETPESKLRNLARALLRLYVGAADSQKILLYELNNLPKTQRDEIVAKQRSLIDFVEGLVGAVRPDLSGSRERLRATVMLYFGMLNWTHTWFRADGPIARNVIADMATGVILGADRQPIRPN